MCNLSKNQFQWIALIICVVSFFLYACSTYKHYPQDNPIEEIVEEVIEKETGIDIDLSPFSDESK